MSNLLQNMISRRRRASGTVAVAGATVTVEEGFLTRMVVAQDSQQDNDRGTGYIHVSSLVRLCPRQLALSRRYSITELRSIRPADRIVWAMGRAAETHVRKQVMASVGMERVVGKWECRCGAVSYEGTHEHTRRCNRCNSASDIYNEFDLIDEGARIAGHPDLPLWLNQQITIVEIKSLNKREFEELTAPKPDHVFQAACYHRLWAMRGTVEVAPKVIILYACKDYIFRGTPYREFHVDVTTGQWPLRVNAAWDTAAQVWASAEQQGAVPPRLAGCHSPSTSQASSCSACVYCFQT